MTTLQDLLAQKVALDKQIADLQKATRTEALQKVRALMSEHGLTAADFVGSAGRATKSAESGPAKKVAAKYRDPVSGKTWSGRGLKPVWFRDALGAGKTAEELAA